LVELVRKLLRTTPLPFDPALQPTSLDVAQEQTHECPGTHKGKNPNEPGWCGNPDAEHEHFSTPSSGLDGAVGSSGAAAAPEAAAVRSAIPQIEVSVDGGSGPHC
jgi:hypothetical protein